jgi:glycosyltransferase involved in cell wall biosynthesis
MAAGKPVVVSDTPPLPEVLGGTGLVVQKTAEGFRRAFVALLQDSGLRAELGRRGRARAQLLDGDLMEHREAEIYRGTCGMAM